MNRRLTTLPAVAGLAAAGLILAACGGDSDAEETPSPAESATEETASAEPSPSEDMATMAADVGDAVGPGCEALAEDLAAVAGEPLVSVAGMLPQLSTLASAVSGGLNPDVDVTEALSVGNITVFAPTDEAFEALDPATLEVLSTDMEALSGILTYHVVPELLGPDEIVGTQLTLGGEPVVVAGEPEALTINDANVICGGIAVADAQVYLIDTVLDPAQAPEAEATPEETASN